MKFNLDQVNQAKSLSEGIFPKLIHEFKKIEVSNFITFVTDGHTEYFDSNNESIISETTQDLIISDELNKEKFAERLKLHQKGGTDYPTFCKDCAENGVDNWIVDLHKMTCTYYDKVGNEVLQELIPKVNE